MKKKPYLYCLVLLILLPLLQGCPYESKMPLGHKSNGTVNEKLFGTWYSDRKVNPSRSIISKGSDHEYKIVHHREVNAKIEISEFCAYTTQIRNETFINVYEPVKRYTSGGFLIYKIAVLDPNTIKITELDKYKVPLDVDTREELISYIQTNKGIYGDSETWLREQQQ